MFHFFAHTLVSLNPDLFNLSHFLGRWKKGGLRRFIRFETVVRRVEYNEATDDFDVLAEDVKEKTQLPVEKFDYVMVATGHYSVPNIPYYPGVEKFPGRVMHAHDFRDACEFKGKRLLVVSNHSNP